MWAATVATGWGLVGGFFTVNCQMVSCAFDASWRMTAVSGTVSEALTGKTLGGAGGFQGFDGDLYVE